MSRTIARKKLSFFAMVNGGEDTISVVIQDGHVRRWVGIGWVDEGPATLAQKRKYPRVGK